MFLIWLPAASSFDVFQVSRTMSAIIESTDGFSFCYTLIFFGFNIIRIVLEEKHRYIVW